MKRYLTSLIVAVALAMTGCRGDSDITRKDQQNYETVQEGSTSEQAELGTIAPAPEMSGTNADTTSAFNLQPGTFQPADPRTIGSTMPPSYPPQATPQPRTPAPPPRIAVDTPQPAPTPAPPREEQPPMTSAAPTPPAPPANDTATTAEPAPEPAPESEEPEQEEPAPEPPPPPPPPTGT